MATHAATRNISGLARALAQHGAHVRIRGRGAADAGADAGVTFVEQVLLGKRMTAQQLAVFASRAFGVPLLDLASFDLDQIHEGLRRHSRLPSRGACCRCTSAATGCTSPRPTRRICRRSTRSGSRPISSSSRSSSRTTSSSAAIAKLVEASGATLQGDGRTSRTSRSTSRTATAGRRQPTRTTPEVEDAPVVRYIQKMLLDAITARRLGHPLRAVREVLPRPLPARRRPDGDRAAAARHQGQAGVAHQGHLAARHLRKARAAGRPHEARAVEDRGDRLPRQHAADAVRREDRDAYPRSVGRQARHRGARLRADQQEPLLHAIEPARTAWCW